MTWVCRRWRDVALASATLWSTFTIGRTPAETRWIPVFLHRAGSVPLNITVEVVGFKRRTLEVLSKPRTATFLRTLHLVLPWPSDYAAITTLMLGHAEHLESLGVIGDGCRRQDNNYVGVDVAPYSFPRLQSLSMLGCAIPMSLILCPSLRIFILDNAWEEVELANLFSVLKRCPLLEQLELHIDKFVLMRTPAPVSLPSLRTLHLEYYDDSLGIDELWRYVSLPIECSIYMYHTFSLLGEQAEVDLLAAITTSIAVLLRHLLSNCPTTLRLQLRTHEVHASFSNYAHTDWNVIVCTTSAPGRQSSPLSVSSLGKFAVLTASLPHLTTMWICSPDPHMGFTSELCVALLAAVPSLESLHIEPRHPSPENALWWADLRPFILALQRVALCPLLERVTFYCIVIDAEALRELDAMLRTRHSRMGHHLQLYMRSASYADGLDATDLQRWNRNLYDDEVRHPANTVTMV